MTGRSIKAGLGVVAAIAASMLVSPTAAHADYAPTLNDVVGVGSDTLQQLVDFAADGSYAGDGGYNTNVRNKFISIDATADANSRLAYGSGGNGSTCAPGTGGTPGTGNQNTTHADTPCVLNPTVTLRAGTSPTQRPNGSGAGYNLLKADTNRTTGKSLNNLVDFSRASSKRAADGTLYANVTVASDPLQMLSSSTTNAPASLTKDQLASIYNCTVTTWDGVGGTGTSVIKPLLPQPGSGTRDYFLAQLGNGTTPLTPGNCVTNVEENDPEAIDASGSPTNAIEPMSVGRLNLFLGKDASGNTISPRGYFKDPSCPFPPAESSTPATCTNTNAAGATATVAPNVKLLTGFAPVRDLFIYFRQADLNSLKKFQPGSNLNWVRTMLYNPCPTPGSATCSTDPVTGDEYGPGGAPYFAQAAAQAAISAAGVTPKYSYNGAA